jgi:hypothetical protein
VFSQSFTPRKKVKFGLEVLAPSVQEIKLEASTEVLNLLKPRRPAMEGYVHALNGKEWEALCMYVQMLNDKLRELQEIMASSEEVLAGLGSGNSVPGAYMNVWSGIGSSLELYQAVATIVGRLVQQVKLNATSVEKINHANMESAHFKTQFVGCYQNEKQKR